MEGGKHIIYQPKAQYKNETQKQLQENMLQSEQNYLPSQQNQYFYQQNPQIIPYYVAIPIPCYYQMQRIPEMNMMGNNLSANSTIDLTTMKNSQHQDNQVFFQGSQQNESTDSIQIFYNHAAHTHAAYLQAQKMNYAEKLNQNFVCQQNQIYISENCLNNKSQVIQVQQPFQNQIMEQSMTSIDKFQNTINIKQEEGLLDHQNIYEQKIANYPNRKIRRRQIYKNESKNVIKIFCYSFIKYMGDQLYENDALFEKFQVNKEEFFRFLNKQKERAITIKSFQQMTIKVENEKQNKFNKIIRIYSNKFLNQEKLTYFVSNKKMKDHFLYLKYRHVLKKALIQPHHFNQVKII